jgi:hypothetical protein
MSLFVHYEPNYYSMSFFVLKVEAYNSHDCLYIFFICGQQTVKEYVL